MKIICFKTLFAACMITVCPLLYSSCVKYPQDTWVRKVTDLKSDVEEEWVLEYDYKGRLVRYGNTPIQYDGQHISAGMLEWNAKKEKIYSVVFTTSNGHVNFSESHCKVKMDSLWVDAYKYADYRWKEDSLFIYSHYKSVDDNVLLRTVESCYIYDNQHNIKEIVTKYFNRLGQEESSCHSYLDYESPIRYTSNLNMCAYITDRDELDTFLYFLLDMSPIADAKLLPNRVRHCVNHGTATYVADALYRMDDEKLVRMELISDRVELKERVEFSYFGN